MCLADVSMCSVVVQPWLQLISYQLAETRSNLPFACCTIHQSVDTVTSNAALGKNFVSHILVNSFKSSQSIALHLHKSIQELSTIAILTIPAGNASIKYAAHLNGSSVFALSPDSCDVFLKDLDIEASFQQANCEHQTTDAGSSDEDLGTLLLVLILDRMVSARRCVAARAIL